MQVAMVLYRWNCFCIGGILSALAFHKELLYDYGERDTTVIQSNPWLNS